MKEDDDDKVNVEQKSRRGNICVRVRQHSEKSDDEARTVSVSFEDKRRSKDKNEEKIIIR